MSSLIGSFINFFVGAFWSAMDFIFKRYKCPKKTINNIKRLREQTMARIAKQLESDDPEVTEKRKMILEWSFEELRSTDLVYAGFTSEEICAFEAVDAYRWKAMEVQQKYNSIVEFVHEAEDWAIALDKQYNGKPKPALFGLPFSVKDNFYMVGYDSSRGLAKYCEWPQQTECSLVSRLRDLGAVPIVRTNVPQLLMAYTCANPVYGVTYNPHDVTRSPGGSSGGDACTVTAGGTPFGTGSDLLGSLRIPAHFCGLYTMKPTAARCKVKHVHPGLPGWSRLGLSYGFFSHEARTQTFIWKNFLSEEYFRTVPTTVPVPLSSERLNKSPLKIGYFKNDGWFSCVPSCVRAVEEAVELLEDAGHTLVPFEVPRPTQAFSIMLKCLTPDNGKYLLGKIVKNNVCVYVP